MDSIIGVQDFGVFLLASVVLNLTPGQDTFYILGRTLSQGRQAGLASVLGISSGGLVHTLSAAIGISALIAASATAFMVLKYVGAAYLVYLGARMLLTRMPNVSVPAETKVESFAKIYRQGLLTSVLNPKVALFFLSFMPQFISGQAEYQVVGLLVLGLCFVCTGTIWCLVLVSLASGLCQGLQANPRIGQYLNRAAGTLFVFLGLRLATSK